MGGPPEKINKTRATNKEMLSEKQIRRLSVAWIKGIDSMGGVP